MDEIDISKLCTSNGIIKSMFVINGMSLLDIINEWIHDFSLIKTDNLDICWTDSFDFAADTDFERYCLEQEHANVPILCSFNGFEFSSEIVVVEIVKTEKCVFGERIGLVDKSDWNYKEEQRSGVLMIEKYSNEDWERLGNTFVFENTDGCNFRKYVTEHWDDELYRRRLNYMFPYFQNNENIKWFSKKKFVFNRTLYDRLVESCYYSSNT
ncbi:MAG: hypothetical protein MJ172_06610 [Clostridia bacterium]|nr:hypothetical protein [Clostridia bacterium]